MSGYFALLTLVLISSLLSILLQYSSYFNLSLFIFLHTVEHSECYKHVRDYVQNGFAEDSIYRTIGSGEQPEKLYNDYNSRTGKNDYDSYPRDVRDAARFRDGMVYADELYLQNLGQDWANIYKEKCKIVFLYESKKQIEEEKAKKDAAKATESGKGKKRKAQDEDEDEDEDEKDLDDIPCCPKNSHTFIHYRDANDEDGDEDDEDGEGTKKAAGNVQTPGPKSTQPPRCTCLTALNHGYLMDYYCSNVEGGQSDNVMREKIFLLIESDVDKIPQVQLKGLK